ncbi:MAG: PucR family transcriptional regulator [Nocardioides sp.]|uniref:PucR family transcriptional regulator n=1 Tax=Nocardioides sp. TaxID=35761 RepID=UPI003EFC14F4
MAEQTSQRTLGSVLDSLPAALVSVVHRGEERPVRAVEIVEPGTRAAAEPGDLLLLVGAASAQAVVDQLATTGAGSAAAGLVLREELAHDPAVVRHCRDAGLPLLALSPEATWTAAHTLLRSSLATTSGAAGTPDPYADLFDLADRIGAVLQAPVTVEDAQSRVLAYSSGQEDVDPARASTIIGRRVPREVRDRLRALGVFRHLTSSDEPLFVPAGGSDMRPRFVVPVRAGGEWLGSVWAVVDDEVPAERVAQVRVAVDVVALHLLRLRSQHDLHQQVRLEQVRALLRGSGDEPGLGDWLGTGPWRVATLSGPRENLSTEDRLAAWSTQLRRRGWNQPLLGDVDGHLHAVVGAVGESAGTWRWLARVAGSEAAQLSGLTAHAGASVDVTASLPDSRHQSVEVAAVAHGAAETLEQRWADVLLARAARGMGGPPLGSPTERLAAHDRAHGTPYVATLRAVLDHWGDLPGAARVLDVHPNTVRNRLPRILEVAAVDLGDPVQRQAVWLECTTSG